MKQEINHDWYSDGMAKHIVDGVTGTDPLNKRDTLKMLRDGYRKAKALLKEEGCI